MCVCACVRSYVPVSTSTDVTWERNVAYLIFMAESFKFATLRMLLLLK